MSAAEEYADAPPTPRNDEYAPLTANSVSIRYDYNLRKVVIKGTDLG